MRRSKLESCEDIMGALVKKSLTIDSLAYETGMSYNTVLHHLEFLIKNGLVEEQNSDNKTLCRITERGVAVLKILNFQKYIEKVANTIRMVDEALQAISTISERKGKIEE